ncbi:death-inducer obliterator 1-like [Lolium rigidum]|uniref:death-inducer obliterator 1-like n=1 Tax=Lolium rigidum TaxID=89674 RepID=UPI001F5D9DB8|nr:death-inducer obliterator 1-like [Lolium rigidum]
MDSSRLQLGASVSGRRGSAGAMELAKQGQPPLPSAAHRPCPALYCPDNWGAQPPNSTYLIVPMGHQPAQLGAPTPGAPHPGGRPLSRVSLRPPQQVLNVDFPEMLMPQRSPPLAGKKMAGKRSAQKESPAEDHSQVQLLDTVRSKCRETLTAALSMGSDRQFRQQSVPDAVVGPSESMPQPNPKRARMSDSDDVHAGAKASQIRPESGRAITTGGTSEEEKVRVHQAQSLASEIEEELFKLFGGVNKKYKEKGRSLLFNLKDKSNPVLRERVLSGDITPRCLCAMNIEELASKELSEWRMAKAEELANMVVLPDREVDVRRLVRKTHKGEFQVEVEETDAIEVGLGGGSLSYAQAKSVDETSVLKEIKESDNSLQDGVAETCNSNTSRNSEYAANEKSVLMQEPMVDDVQVTENLPQIMTLDEFMQVLDSEPHSEDQSTGALQDDPSIGKADKALKSGSFPIAKDKAAALKFQFHSDLRSPQDNFESKLESTINKSFSIMNTVLEPNRDVTVKSPPEKVDDETPDTVNGSIAESTMQCKITPDAAFTYDSIWEGTIQLSLTSLTNIVAIFKSGEKPSTNEWRRFLEIKGRVRLSVFKEFLEQLPNSRSRAIMVTELCSKEGSLESGRHHLLQTIDSYTADGRVGLVKPAEWVEMYLCPQGKAAEILADHLPKEHSGSLTVTGTSIIGLVVWRRPHVSHKVPPNRQDVHKSPATVSSSVVPRISQPPSRASNVCRSHQDDVTSDSPPGFGRGVFKDYNGLPEYNSVGLSNLASNATTPQTNKSHQHTCHSEYPRMREMVRKYGNESVAAQPWNGDGSNIPEWYPNSQSNLQQMQIPQAQFPCQQQPQYHLMFQYHTTREYQSPLPQAYAQHQHTAMPVQHPLTYGHLMQPAQQCYYGVPDGTGQSQFAGAWNQGLMPWNLR